eukprot:COSAG02_NODE_38281_length_431_cov_0.524096_1_plen_71_part_10
MDEHHYSCVPGGTRTAVDLHCQTRNSLADDWETSRNTYCIFEPYRSESADGARCRYCNFRLLNTKFGAPGA